MHGCKEEGINLIPHYLIDIIQITVKLSHLEKLWNINYLMFQVIFIFSDWILIKQVIVSCTPFCCSWNIFLKKCCLLELVIIFSLGCYDKNLGVIFDWGRAWVKMPRYNAFSRNVNIMYLKILRTHGVIYKFEKEFNKHSGEREIKP